MPDTMYFIHWMLSTRLFGKINIVLMTKYIWLIRSANFFYDFAPTFTMETITTGFICDKMRYLVQQSKLIFQLIFVFHTNPSAILIGRRYVRVSVRVIKCAAVFVGTCFINTLSNANAFQFWIVSDWYRHSRTLTNYISHIYLQNKSVYSIGLSVYQRAGTTNHKSSYSVIVAASYHLELRNENAAAFSTYDLWCYPKLI